MKINRKVCSSIKENALEVLPETNTLFIEGKKMIIAANGVRLQVDQDGRILRVTVLEQTKEASHYLKIYGQLQDDGEGKTDIILRTNKYPSWNKNLKKLFIRGEETERDNDVVTIKFKTTKEATDAIAAFQRLLDKLVPIELSLTQPRFIPGSVGAIRMHFIDRDFAVRTGLTGHDHYPIKTLDWEPVQPAYCGVFHYDSHLGQAIRLLNISVDKDYHTENTTNPHFASRKQAIDAIDIMKFAFAKSRELKCEVAFWRLLTIYRSCDVLNMPLEHVDIALKNQKKEDKPKYSRKKKTKKANLVQSKTEDQDGQPCTE